MLWQCTQKVPVSVSVVVNMVSSNNNSWGKGKVLLMSLIHLELIFVQCEKYGSNFFLPWVDTQFMPAPFVE